MLLHLDSRASQAADKGHRYGKIIFMNRSLERRLGDEHRVHKVVYHTDQTEAIWNE